MARTNMKELESRINALEGVLATIAETQLTMTETLTTLADTVTALTHLTASVPETPSTPEKPSTAKGASAPVLKHDHSDKVGTKMTASIRTRYANRVGAGHTPDEAIKSIHKHYEGKYTLDTIRAIVGA